MPYPPEFLPLDLLGASPPGAPPPESAATCLQGGCDGACACAAPAAPAQSGEDRLESGEDRLGGDPAAGDQVLRRRFFRDALALFGGLAAGQVLGAVTAEAAALEQTAAEPGVAIPGAPTFSEEEGRHLIVRMQQELQRAMAKPIEHRRWVMVIDLRKCTGCGACTVSCIAENHLPPGVVYRPVIEEEIGTFPNVSARSIPRPCMQCENPPCVPVCPVKATFVRPDGIVDMDYTRCIGCRYCMTACPYHARTFDFGYNYTDGTPARQPYEEAANYEYGERWSREGRSSPVGNVRKCHFCTHKLDAGMLPSCVTSCIGYATFFGDANDPDSLVSQLISRPNKMRLKEEMGTKPRVYYLV